MSYDSHSITVQDSVDDIRKILNIDQALSGIEYLKVLIKNIGTHLGFKYVFVGHPSEDNQRIIETDVVWGNDDYQSNFNYELISTPCEIVMSGVRVCVHEHSVCQKFPEDELLQQMGVEAYAGTPILSPAGELLGLLVLADNKAIVNSEYIATIVDFLAQRVAAEYERYKIEQDLNKIIEQRTQELEETNIQLRNAVAELELAKKDLELKSRIDSLTHVYNREWFTSLACSQLNIAKRYGYSIALLFIDLDYFKKVNDTYGHVVGDKVLKEVASRIKYCVRDIDILGRFGGEEFVLLSPYTDNESAVQFASRINDEISVLPIHTQKNDIFITTSIGVATSGANNSDLTTLVKHADVALYKAKENGRNTCCVY